MTLRRPPWKQERPGKKRDEKNNQGNFEGEKEKEKGFSGQAITEELSKIPEFKAFFQNLSGGQA